jgi:RNA polymerase sigma factor (sigma-70 family)
MTADEEPVTSILRILGDGGLDDAELDRRVSKFQGALRRLRDDPAEAARLDALVMDAEHSRAAVTSDDSRGGTPIAGDLESQQDEVGHPDSDVVSEFGGWYLRNRALVVRFLMRLGASLDAAEDATQEAFAEAWRRIQLGTWADIVNQETWIRIVALNIHRQLSGQRKQPASVPVAGLPEIPQPGAGHAELTAGALLVLDTLRSLPFELQVIVAFKMEGFPASVAARYLGVTDQKARNLLKTARRTLVRKLALLSDDETSLRHPDRDKNSASRSRNHGPDTVEQHGALVDDSVAEPSVEREENRISSEEMRRLSRELDAMLAAGDEELLTCVTGQRW